jgi:hypothetical protein
MQRWIGSKVAPLAETMLWTGWNSLGDHEIAYH